MLGRDRKVVPKGNRQVWKIMENHGKRNENKNIVNLFCMVYKFTLLITSWSSSLGFPASNPGDCGIAPGGITPACPGLSLILDS